MVDNALLNIPNVRRKIIKIILNSILLRNVQEVQLDKHVKLLDSPGIVMDSGTSDSSIILRNCVKVRVYLVNTIKSP